MGGGRRDEAWQHRAEHTTNAALCTSHPHRWLPRGLRRCYPAGIPAKAAASRPWPGTRQSRLPSEIGTPIHPCNDKREIK
jgi:hypothetical protein